MHGEVLCSLTWPGVWSDAYGLGFRAMLLPGRVLTLGHDPSRTESPRLRAHGDLRLATALLILVVASSAAAQQQSGAHRPLPQQVLSKAPEMHPFGKGRHAVWGLRVYDATLWIVGPQWSPDGPHALDIEPGRSVAAETLVKSAIVELRNLRIGDESKLRSWQTEMTKVIPSVREGDQVVIFCPPGNRTFVYFNDSNVGEIDDPSFCPAVMNVWLHPQTKHQTMRKSLLRE